MLLNTDNTALKPHLANLNPQQLEAVQHFLGPILILAGAGSGKTRVLTRRVANLITEHHVNPWNILAVTFTNKATSEMRERLGSMLGEKAKNIWVSTFHSAGLRILRKNALLLGYSMDFTVYDDSDSRNLLKQIIKELKIDEKRFKVSLFEYAIDWAKNNLVRPEEYASCRNKGMRSRYETSLEAEVYEKYQRALRQANAMDFGDLLMNAVLLLKQDQSVLSYYRNLLHFVLVDEFQDTNQVQYEFVKLITETRKNLLVVGDDDQSIYAFRGATIENILNFEKDFPDCKVVKLEQNYRSTSNILNAAHGVIKENTGRKKKKLWTAGAEGEIITAYTASDETAEAEFVVEQIEGRLSQGCSMADIAIFYRTNAQSRALEEALVNHSLPYRIFGGQKFYERKEIKDILSYLKLILNDSDDQSLLRIINTPTRGIGAQAVQKLCDAAREMNTSLFKAASRLAEEGNKNLKKFVDLIEELKSASGQVFLSELIKQTIEKTLYGPKLKEMHDITALSRLENLTELEAIGRSMELTEEPHLETLKHFLDRVCLTGGDERPEDTQPGTGEAEEQKKKETITLMTLHLAKGLEFPVVFITGVEEGLLPHQRSMFIPEELEEERRLFYVGITRAMKVLYLSHAWTRGMVAGGGYHGPSRFMEDIPCELLERSFSESQAYDYEQY